MIFYDTDSGLKNKAYAYMHYLERVKLILPAEEAADRLAGRTLTSK